MAKHRSPSRIRYERSHPVVSFRANKEMIDRFTILKEKEGESHADIYKIGLEKTEWRIEKEEQIRKKAYEDGQADGYQQGALDAMDRYLIEYPCSLCGELIMLESKKEKEEVIRHMREQGWRHRECMR